MIIKNNNVMFILMICEQRWDCYWARSAGGECRVEKKKIARKIEFDSAEKRRTKEKL